jgi:hypothetical protein
MDKIFLGTVAGDKTGTPAREAGKIINDNFTLLENNVNKISFPDIVLKTGVITIVGLNGSIEPEAFSWRINNFTFLPALGFTFTLDVAANDNYRIDAVLGTITGSYNIFKGTESATAAVPPTVFPANTIFLGYIYLFGNTVVDITSPNQLGTSDFIAKSELSSRKLFGTGNKSLFSINSDAATFRIMEALSIGSVSVSDGFLKFIYPGKDHYVRNETGRDLTIKHNAGSGNYKYFFPNGLDLVIKNSEIVQFKFRFTANNAGLLDYVGVASTGAVAVITKQPFTDFKFIQKGFGNVDLSINEVGDIFCGWSNDGTIRYLEAIYLGGALTDSANFTPLITVIIEN